MAPSTKKSELDLPPPDHPPLVGPRPRTSSVVSLPSRAEIDGVRLVEGLLAEEPWAQAALFDLHAATVRRILRRMLGPGVDVDDAHQDVFIAFFRSVRSLEQPGALRSFLIGIAVRVAASELRRRRLRRWLMLTPDGAVPEEVDPGLDDVARAALRKLYAVLDDLDVTARLLFVLRHVEELSLPEVAASMQMSLSTAKRKLAKATAVVLSRVRRDPDLEGYVARTLGAPSVEAGLEEGKMRGVRP